MSAVRESAALRENKPSSDVESTPWESPQWQEAVRQNPGLAPFFDNLESFVELPEGVKKLRGLFLELAIRGELISQDESDEPARELLGRFETERAKLIRSKQLKKVKLAPSIDDNEAPFKIPSSWFWTTVDRVFLVVTDGDHKAPPRAENGVPFLVIGNVRTGELQFDGSRFVREDYFEELDPLRKPKMGDLLYTVTGSYGISVRVTSDREFCVQRHIGILKPATVANVDYMHVLMSSPFVFEQATACATGIAQKTVPLSGLRSIVVPLPPLAEQRRIVSKVESLMSLCDSLESRQTERESVRERASRSVLASLTSSTRSGNGAKSKNDSDLASAWQRLSDHFEVLLDQPETIAHLRQSILQLAVQGKLVPQDPSDEPAEEMLQSLLEIRDTLIADGSLKNRKPLTEEQTADPMFEAPLGWSWSRFECLADLASGVTKGRKLEGRETADFPYLRVANVQRWALDLKVMKDITIPIEELEKYRLKKGDLLMTEGGAFPFCVGSFPCVFNSKWGFRI